MAIPFRWWLRAGYSVGGGASSHQKCISFSAGKGNRFPVFKPADATTRHAPMLIIRSIIRKLSLKCHVYEQVIQTTTICYSVLAAFARGVGKYHLSFGFTTPYRAYTVMAERAYFRSIRWKTNTTTVCGDNGVENISRRFAAPKCRDIFNNHQIMIRTHVILLQGTNHPISLGKPGWLGGNIFVATRVKMNNVVKNFC